MLFRKYLSPDGDSGGTGGDDGTTVIEPQTPPASSGTQSQQDLLKQIGALQAKYDADLAAAENRRVGLQKTYDTQKAVWQQTQTELLSVKNTLDLLTGEKTTLAEQNSNLEKDKETLTHEVGTLGVKVKRANLIFDKYHGLASFEAAGLIPDVPEEKLEETFQTFADKLATITDASKMDFSSGSTPIPPDKKDGKPESLEILKKRLNDAALKGDRAVYDKTYNEILKAETAKK
jgi:hypothetical protein